jgi:hypothetical protein
MFAPFAPWDPSLYSGWWPWIDQVVPTFLSPNLHLAVTWLDLGLELLGLGVLAAAVLSLAGARLGRWGTAATVVALVVAISGVLVFLPRSQPTSTLSWSGTNLGAPWSATSDPVSFPPVSLVDVGPGTYEATFKYSISGTGAPGATAKASLLVTPQQRVRANNWFTPLHPTDAALMSTSLTAPDYQTAGKSDVALQTVPGDRLQSRTVNIEIMTHTQSLLSFQVEAGPATSVSASSLVLKKTAS